MISHSILKQKVLNLYRREGHVSKNLRIAAHTISLLLAVSAWGAGIFMSRLEKWRPLLQQIELPLAN
jgi:hypothetical protein